MYFAAKCSGPFTFNIGRPPKRNPRKLLGKNSQAVSRALKAMDTFCPTQTPKGPGGLLAMGQPTEVLPQLDLWPSRGTAARQGTLNGQLVGHSSCISPHKLLSHIPFTATDSLESTSLEPMPVLQSEQLWVGGPSQYRWTDPLWLDSPFLYSLRACSSSSMA